MGQAERLARASGRREGRSRGTAGRPSRTRAGGFVFLRAALTNRFTLCRNGACWAGLCLAPPENLRAVSEVLKTVELRSTDFELALHDIDESDFVYFDPPYHPLGGYSDFKRYTPDQFREHDHIRLACLCRDLDRQGVRWVVSNSDTPFVRELYKDYLVYEINARREINLDSTKRDVKELIITNMTVEAPQKEVEQVEQIPLF